MRTRTDLPLGVLRRSVPPGVVARSARSGQSVRVNRQANLPLAEIRPTPVYVTASVAGAFYGLPLMVAGRVLNGQYGVAVLLFGVLLSAVAALRGWRVAVMCDGERIVVRNRWRTRTCLIDEDTEIVPVTTWWMWLGGMVTLDLHGVQVSHHMTSIPAMATLGQRSDSGPVQALRACVEAAKSAGADGTAIR